MFYRLYRRIIDWARYAEGIPSLLMRLVLAPVLIIAGFNKLGLSSADVVFPDVLLAKPGVIEWFGNAEWGLGLPYPDLLAFLAGWTEFLGGWLLLIGLLTRLVAVPLMITMLVAALSVHWHNGWFAVAPSNPDTSAARVLAWLNVPGAAESLDNSVEVRKRLDKINELLDENGYPEYLYEKGRPVILNNGIEFAAIYFIMLLALFFYGGGRYVSLDYWLVKRISR